MFNKNDIVYFSGNTHYISSTSSQGKSCNPGPARISNLADMNDAHPIHVIADTYGSSNVYGWVSAQDVSTLTVEQAIDRLAYLQIINSPDYWKNLAKQVSYLDALLIKSNNFISNKKTNSLTLSAAIDTLISAKIINSPEYWKEKAIKYNNIGTLLTKIAESIDSSFIPTPSNLRNTFGNCNRNISRISYDCFFPITNFYIPFVNI